MKKKSANIPVTKKAPKKYITPKREPEQLLLLSKEEQGQPVKILDHFFDCYNLKNLRRDLWDWLSAAIGTDNGIYEIGRQRNNLIFLYEQLEQLIEAAYLLHWAPKFTRKKAKKR